jgi:dsDNA-specific endonuclease/ATPase MutS2
MKLINWIRRTFLERSLDTEAKREADDDSVDPYNPFPEPVTVEITDVIDLHTIPPRDVQRIVEEYLFQARQLGFQTVRVIHGKGVGVQQRMVRSILDRTSYVSRWTDAPPEAGGQGATIVWFSRD